MVRQKHGRLAALLFILFASTGFAVPVFSSPYWATFDCPVQPGETVPPIEARYMPLQSQPVFVPLPFYRESEPRNAYELMTERNHATCRPGFDPLGAQSRTYPSPQPLLDRSQPAGKAVEALTYEVQRGDTLFRIAKQFEVTVEELVRSNHIANRNLLQVGQKLQIPSSLPIAKLPDSGPDMKRVAKVLKSKLTAYTAGPESTGKTPSHPQYGITFSGKKATEGRTIAVDPKVIPLGTTVYIEGIGYRTAEDTGPAIKGNRIDVFMNDVKEALKFGVKNDVTIYVLSNETSDATS